MNLSKSKYTNACICKKMLWLETYKPEVKGEIDSSNAMDNGNVVHEVARDLLGAHVTIPFNTNLAKMLEDTERELKKDKVIVCEASFTDKNNFCSVDILEKNNTEYNLYEVKGSTKEKDIFLKDISYQYYVLTKLGLKVNKCFLVHINNKYYKKGKLDLNKLFIKIDVTDKIKNLQEEVEFNIKEIDLYMKNKNEPNDSIGLYCFKPYECPYFKYCIKDLPCPNVFDIGGGMRLSQKLELYKMGKVAFKDLLDENINLKYKQQIEFEIFDKEDYINKDKIKEFLDTLSYPLYFLDFETFQLPIPKYDNTNAYMQIPFQYSLHYIEKEGGKLYHKEFLGRGDDPRRELAERLVKDIPKNVCVLAYNMGFEKGRIKELANIFPDLKEHLMNIHDNIKDLAIPFMNRDYYNKNMNGYYTIKKVLPALYPNEPSLDYHNLELVHNGGEAMSYYDTLSYKTKEEQDYIRERLLKYCCLDTYAMVKIYEKLKKIK